ncbi:phosphohydrolase [Rhizobium sp. CG5]|uniref:metallophosphoesterase n=1 Tax=Rhizobium sp. CG5 TaxID=2726076 RepID=UPI002034344A|nr:metallophosphoesterase [Rhizobium sp. CG5]MCM2475586.1 phosphohydrolase [Rhizobium sp. CG5]
MRAWIVSDMHVHDPASAQITIPDADICICAGDVSGHVDVTWNYLQQTIAPHMPVVAVLGNHDFYHGTIDAVLEIMRLRTHGTNITILENSTIEIGGVQIIGATLWTDFLLPFGGVGPELKLPFRKNSAIDACQKHMVDFRAIYGSPSYGAAGLIWPDEMIGRHEVSRSFINNALAKTFPGKRIVVTHHAPSPLSQDSRYIGSPTNPAFISDLTELIQRWQPDLWVHGHVHQFFDYKIGNTRVLCNPKGYAKERTGFRPELVISI